MRTKHNASFIQHANNERRQSKSLTKNIFLINFFLGGIYFFAMIYNFYIPIEVFEDYSLVEKLIVSFATLSFMIGINIILIFHLSQIMLKDANNERRRENNIS